MKKVVFGALFLVLMGTTLTFTSCEKSEDELIENTIQDNFKKSETMDDPTSHLRLSTFEKPDTVSYNFVQKKAKITVADLWSKKSRCMKIGICKWFPKDRTSISDNNYQALLSGRTIFIFTDDILKSDKFVLYFQNRTFGVSNNDLTFVVSDDIFISSTKKISAGDYPFKSSLGSYGGYEISLTDR